MQQTDKYYLYVSWIQAYHQSEFLAILQMIPLLYIDCKLLRRNYFKAEPFTVFLVLDKTICLKCRFIIIIVFIITFTFIIIIIIIVIITFLLSWFFLCYYCYHYHYFFCYHYFLLLSQIWRQHFTLKPLPHDCHISCNRFPLPPPQYTHTTTTKNGLK